MLDMEGTDEEEVMVINLREAAVERLPGCLRKEEAQEEIKFKINMWLSASRKRKNKSCEGISMIGTRRSILWTISRGRMKKQDFDRKKGI